MRKNKKILQYIALNFVIVLNFFVIVIITGCSDSDSDNDVENVNSQNSIIGKWRLISHTFNDQDGECPGSIFVSSQNAYLYCPIQIFQFNSNGTYILNSTNDIDGDSSREEGEWELEGCTLIITALKKGYSLNGTVDEDDMEFIVTPEPFSNKIRISDDIFYLSWKDEALDGEEASWSHEYKRIIELLVNVNQPF